MATMSSMDAICDDLAAEQDALDVVVAPLPPEAWEMATPAPGWAVRDQIGHLQFFDATATLAATDAEAFKASVSAMGPMDNTPRSNEGDDLGRTSRRVARGTEPNARHVSWPRREVVACRGTAHR